MQVPTSKEPLTRRNRLIAMARANVGRLIGGAALSMGLVTISMAWISWSNYVAEIERTERSSITNIATLLAPRIDGTAHEALAHQFPVKDAMRSWNDAPQDVHLLRDILTEAVRAAGVKSPIYTLRLRDEHIAIVRAAPDQVHHDAMEFILTTTDAPYWRRLYEYRPEMAKTLFQGLTSTTGL